MLFRVNKPVSTSRKICAKDIPRFVNDLLNCKKWKSTFGSCHNKVDQESIFLTNLAAEYKRCKDKDLSKAVRLRSAKQTQKILIGQTLRDSRISLSGATSEVFKSRVDAAKDLGRIREFCQLLQQITYITQITHIQY